MDAAIILNQKLGQLRDLLDLTLEDLEAMALEEIVQTVAQVLRVPAYQLEKDELIDTCWAELEHLRVNVSNADSTGGYLRQTLLCLRRDLDYTMPVADVAKQIYERLSGIVLTKSNLQEMRDNTNWIVASLTRSEMKEFEFSTVRTRRVDIKKTLDSMVDCEIPLLQETLKNLIEYFYNQLLNFQKEDSSELFKTYRSKVNKLNRDKTSIEISRLVANCKHTLKILDAGDEPHWTQVSIALALGTGRRMSEIHALGSFTVTGEFEMLFSGQAKTRGAENANLEYKIPTLFPAEQMKKGIDYLQKIGRRIAPEEQHADRNATTKAFGTAMCRAMKTYSGIPYKGLRAIYAEAQWLLIPNIEAKRVEKHIKYSDWLGHSGDNGYNDTTFMSYMIFNITDWEEVEKLLK